MSILKYRAESILRQAVKLESWRFSMISHTPTLKYDNGVTEFQHTYSEWSRMQPEIVFQFGDLTVIIEVDELDHISYSSDREAARVFGYMENFGAEIALFRISTEYRTVRSEAERLKELLKFRKMIVYLFNPDNGILKSDAALQIIYVNYRSKKQIQEMKRRFLQAEKSFDDFTQSYASDDMDENTEILQKVYQHPLFGWETIAARSAASRAHVQSVISFHVDEKETIETLYQAPETIMNMKLEREQPHEVESVKARVVARPYKKKTPVPITTSQL